MTQCAAKIRPLSDDTEIVCERDADDGHHDHAGVLSDYAFPGSRTLTQWNEDDRRTFRGGWSPCKRTKGCVLPRHHPRGCEL